MMNSNFALSLEPPSSEWTCDGAVSKVLWKPDGNLCHCFHLQTQLKRMSPLLPAGEGQAPSGLCPALQR